MDSKEKEGKGDLQFRLTVLNQEGSPEKKAHKNLLKQCYQ